MNEVIDERTKQKVEERNKEIESLIELLKEFKLDAEKEYAEILNDPWLKTPEFKTDEERQKFAAAILWARSYDKDTYRKRILIGIAEKLHLKIQIIEPPRRFYD